MTAVRDIILEVMAEHVKSSLGITDVTDSQLTDMIVKEAMVRVQSGVLPPQETLTELIISCRNDLLPLTSDPESESDSSIPTVIEVIEDKKNPVIEAWPAAEEKRKGMETVKKKMAVKLFVETLVVRIVRKSKVNLKTVDSDIILRLFERTWILVEIVDFDISQKTFKHLDKIIFKDLCKNWGSPEMVLLAMAIGEPELGNCIAFAIRHHLTTGPKKSRISRFFSSVGCAFKKSLHYCWKWKRPIVLRIFIVGMVLLLLSTPTIILVLISGTVFALSAALMFFLISVRILIQPSQIQLFSFGYGSFEDVFGRL